MATGLSEEQIAEIRHTFLLFDRDGSGTISTVELGQVMKSLGQDVDEHELKEMIAEVDADGSGEIDFSEFLIMMTNKLKQGNTEDDLKEAFRVIDRDGSGTISTEELKLFLKSLGEDVEDEDINELIDEVDTDHSGTINFEEFVKVMTNK